MHDTENKRTNELLPFGSKHKAQSTFHRAHRAVLVRLCLGAAEADLPQEIAQLQRQSQPVIVQQDES